jgi:hypothetical protein
MQILSGYYFLKTFIKQLRNKCIDFEELPTGDLKIANAVLIGDG